MDDGTGKDLRGRIRRALALAAAAVPLLFAAGALVVDGWEARRFLLLYLAPFFVAFFAWARLRLDSLAESGRGALAVDVAAVALGALRFAGGPVPFSGHMMFFVFSALTTRSAAYRLLALALAVETTWFKLVSWRDPVSWALGIALGAALAATHALASRSTRAS